MRKTVAVMLAAVGIALAGCSEDSDGRSRDGEIPVGTPTADTANSAPSPTAGPTTAEPTTTEATETTVDASDPHGLVQNAAVFMEEATAVEIQMEMQQSLDVQGTAVTTDQQMTGPQIVDPFQADFTVVTTSMGQTATSRMIVTNDGTATTLYTHDSISGAWTQTTVTPEQAASLNLDAGFNPMVSFLRSLPADAAIAAAPATTASGAPATELTIDLDSERLSQIFGYTASGIQVEGTGTLVLTVDNATGEPSSSVITTDISDLGGLGAVQQTMTTTYSAWNVMPTITVPDEALNAPVDDTILGGF